MTSNGAWWESIAQIAHIWTRFRTRDCPGRSVLAPDSAEAKVLPSVKARAPQAEGAARRGSAVGCGTAAAGSAHRRNPLRRARSVRYRGSRRRHLAVAPRQSPAHHDAPGDHRRPAAVQERRSLPARPARRVGAHPARHALPARCAHPPRRVSRRRRRPRSHDAGRLDLQPRHFLRPQGRREHRRVRARRAQLPRHWNAARRRLRIRSRSRFEIHQLPRPPARLVLVGPVDRATRTTATAASASSRSSIRSTRSARRWAGGVALLDDQRTDSRYDLGEIVDQFETHEKLARLSTGACPTAWSTAGRAAFGRPDLRRPRIRARARALDRAVAAAVGSHAGVSVDRRRMGAGCVSHRAQPRPDREDRGLLARLARARAAGLREHVVRLGSRCRDAGRQRCRRAWS